ncbi:hypothetical protein [Streptomyces sp. NPDC048644]|uniref:hypothetical protein n=1 Tax=Streptomyces sp. NPDC048644 TaxID=3365582 RepID=UPI00371088FB
MSTPEATRTMGQDSTDRYPHGHRRRPAATAPPRDRTPLETALMDVGIGPLTAAAHRPDALIVARTTTSAHALPATAPPCAADRLPHAPAAAH